MSALETIACIVGDILAIGFWISFALLAAVAVPAAILVAIFL